MTNHSSGERRGSGSWLERLLCKGRASFYAAALITICMALIPVYALHDLLAARLSFQEKRNAYLQQEVVKLDKTIAAVRSLRAQTQDLLSRQYDVEWVHNARATDVRLFNFLARGVPPEVQLTRVDYRDGRLALQGLTRSAPAVKALMHNAEDYPFLDSPALDFMQAQDGQLQEFRIEARVLKSAKPSAAPARRAAEPSQPAAAQGHPASLARDEPDEPDANSAWMLPLALAVVVLAAISLAWRRLRKGAAGERKSWLRRTGDAFAAVRAGDLSTWGLMPRLAVLLEIFVIAVFASWLLVLDPAFETYSDSVDKEERLKQEFLRKKLEEVNLDLIEKQLRDTRKTFGALEHLVPARLDSGEFYAALHKTAGKYGITIRRLQRETETVRGALVLAPMQVELFGSFDAIGAFLADVARMEPLADVAGFALTPDAPGASKGRSMMLRFDGELVSYRYRAQPRKDGKPEGGKK